MKLRSHPRAALKLAALAPRLLSQLARDQYALILDYDVQFRRRWTERQPHRELRALLAAGIERYRATLREFLPLRADLAAISEEWQNRWIPPLDAISIYGLLAARRPRLYLEIGSGFSTRFARRAIRDQRLPTRIVSVDPEPRADVDALCDQVVRSRMETVDLAIFDQLQPGDMLLLDGSHRCLPNSDVTAFFLEVLARLPPEVLVGVHDIFLPYDYPEAFLGRYYSEQYVLGAWLLADRGHRLSVVLPMAYLAATGVAQAELQTVLNVIPSTSGDAGMFWMATTLDADAGRLTCDDERQSEEPRGRHPTDPP